MNNKNDWPSREELDEAFHLLQDQITKITVEEEEEMVRNDSYRKSEPD